MCIVCRFGLRAWDGYIICACTVILETGVQNLDCENSGYMMAWNDSVNPLMIALVFELFLLLLR